ncbi:unnamed protein product [Sphagnum troendelagicum]
METQIDQGSEIQGGMGTTQIPIDYMDTRMEQLYPSLELGDEEEERLAAAEVEEEEGDYVQNANIIQKVAGMLELDDPEDIIAQLQYFRSYLVDYQEEPHSVRVKDKEVQTSLQHTVLPKVRGQTEQVKFFAHMCKTLEANTPPYRSFWRFYYNKKL